MKIKTAKDLQIAILELENKKLIQERELRFQFGQVYQKLKPSTIVNSILNEISVTPGTKKNLLNTIIGLGAGFLSKKILIGKSNNFFKKIFGTAFEYGVANMVTQNIEKIKTVATELKNKLT